MPPNDSFVSATFTVDTGNGNGAVFVVVAVAVAAADVTEMLRFKNFSLGDGNTYPTEVLRRISHSSLSDDCKISCDSETASIAYTRTTCAIYVT